DEEQAWFWFSEQQSVGITRRMQTHEATLHRVDAELTAGQPVSAIDARLAAAGLDHVLEVMWPAAYEWIPDWAERTPVAAIEIRPQGGSTRWLGIDRWRGTRPRDGEEFDVPVGRPLDGPPAEGELPRAGASGSPVALCLWAWGREKALEHLAGGAEAVRLQGDPEAIAALEALIAEGHDGAPTSLGTHGDGLSRRAAGSLTDAGRAPPGRAPNRPPGRSPARRRSAPVAPRPPRAAPASRPPARASPAAAPGTRACRCRRPGSPPHCPPDRRHPVRRRRARRGWPTSNGSSPSHPHRSPGPRGSRGRW